MSDLSLTREGLERIEKQFDAARGGIKDYRRIRETPDPFPGDRTLATLNITSYLGDYMAPVVQHAELLADSILELEIDTEPCPFGCEHTVLFGVANVEDKRYFGGHRDAKGIRHDQCRHGDDCPVMVALAIVKGREE